MRTIQEALAEFLDAERARAPKEFEGTDLAIDLFIKFLEGYGYQYAEDESDEFGDPEDESDSFIDISDSRILPTTVNEFLYFWQIRKFSGDADDARATGRAIERLMEWLAHENLADATSSGEAAALARTATDEVPRALELQDLLGALTRMTPVTRASDQDEVVEDFQRITRVESGQLWLTEDVGPIAVTTETSEAAEVGWWINVVVERRGGTWYLTELGGVYPRLDEGDDDDIDRDVALSVPT